MNLSWDTEETIKYCWNTPSYKSCLTEVIKNELDFYDRLSSIISLINKDILGDRIIDIEKVDGNEVYIKFCELLEISCEYEDIEQLQKKNIQYSRNEDCIDCGTCFENNDDICSWDDSQIVSMTNTHIVNGEIITSKITDKKEIEEYIENEKRMEKESEDKKWKKDLKKDILNDNLK